MEDCPTQKHDWGKMVKNVQMHIKGLNWGYKSDMIKLKVKYFNSYATFTDAHTINLDNGKGKVESVTADKIVIAVGGRPSYPGIPGDKEFGITSDDIFSLKEAPGRTLVVGASYVALESTVLDCKSKGAWGEVCTQVVHVAASFICLHPIYFGAVRNQR